MPPDITVDPNAPPTANILTPVGAPVTPGVSRPGTPERPTHRFLSPRLSKLLARFLGFSYDEQTGPVEHVAERVIPVIIMADLSKAPEQDETITGSQYKVFTIDLSVARNRIPIDGTQDMVIANIALTQLTASGTFRLHVGDRDGILFGGTGLGVGGGLEMNPPEQTRLSITNAAQAATTAELTVSAGVRITL